MVEMVECIHLSPPNFELVSKVGGTEDHYCKMKTKNSIGSKLCLHHYQLVTKARRMIENEWMANEYDAAAVAGD